jgi:hypothetical protein
MQQRFNRCRSIFQASWKAMPERHREWLWIRLKSCCGSGITEISSETGSGSVYLQCLRTYAIALAAASSPDARAQSRWVVGINVLSSLSTERAEKEHRESSQPGGIKFSMLNSLAVCSSIAERISGISIRFSFLGESEKRPKYVIG